MSAWGRFPGGDFHPPHGMPFALQPLLHARRHRQDVLLVERVVGHHELDLIEVGLFSQLREGVEGDVAVDDVLHARLGLAHVVDGAAHSQGPLISAGGPHGHGVADPRASTSTASRSIRTSPAKGVTPLVPARGC